MPPIYESDLEKLAIELLEKEGYRYLPPEEQENERANLSEVVLADRLKQAIDRINPRLPQSAKEQAVKTILTLPSQNLIDNNLQISSINCSKTQSKVNYAHLIPINDHNFYHANIQ